MGLDRGTTWKMPQWAMCSKCGTPVYTVSVREPYDRTIADENGNNPMTGEVIVAVECHGERWEWSSWHGTQDGTPLVDIKSITQLAALQRS